MTWHLLLDYDRAEHVPGSVVEVVAGPEPNTVVGRTVGPDSARAHEIIRKRCERAGYRVTMWAFERSTNGWHAKVALDPVPESPMEIVALQAVCGSDPLRESCNIARAGQVERFPSYAARRLIANVEARQYTEPAMQANAAALVDMLREYANTPDAFWLDRWNTLYAPNPHRRRSNAHGE